MAFEDLSNAEVLAYSIAFSEMEGAKFDWESMKFDERING